MTEQQQEETKQVEDINYNGNLSNFALSIFLSDVTLIDSVNKQEYKSHKIILASYSNILYKVIKGNPSINSIRLPIPMEIQEQKESKRLDILKGLLHFMYGSRDIQVLQQNGLNGENYFEYLSYSMALEIQDAVNVLEENIVSTYIQQENAVQQYGIGYKLNSKKIMEKCLNEITRHFEELYQQENNKKLFVDLPLHAVQLILESDELDVSNEDILLQYIIDYINSCSYLQDKPETIIQPDSTTTEQIKEEIVQQQQEEEQVIQKDKEEDTQQQEQQEQEQQEQQEEVEKGEEDKEEQQKKVVEDEVVEQQVVQEEVVDMNIEGNERMRRYRLTENQKSYLINKLRIVYISHEQLFKASGMSILSQQKDIFLQGLSAKLKKYEQISVDKYDINMNPRASYNKQVVVVPDNPFKVVIDIHQQNNVKNDSDPLISIDPIKSEVFKSGIRYQQQQQQDIQQQQQQQSQLYQSIKPPKQQQQYNNKNRVLNFEYVSDFDKNGVLYYLGTLGRTQQQWQNPHSIGQVQVFFSSLGKGTLEDFVGRDIVNCRTLNEKNSFMGIDLGLNRFLKPTCYTLRNRGQSNHVLFNWVLEASIDSFEWIILDKRIHLTHDPDINAELQNDRILLSNKGITTTWGLDPHHIEKILYSLEKSRNTKIPGFRYFRIKQISQNSSGSYNLALSGFEIYGEATGANWIF